MTIRKRILCGLAIASVATIQNARGAEGRPDQNTLSQMGLGGLVAMADSEAESVRGMGFKGGNYSRSSAQASGSSYANIVTPYGNAHSQNRYSAEGSHYASGENESYAGVQISSSHGQPGNGGNWRGNGGSYPGNNNRNCGNNSGPSHPMGGNPCGGGGGGYGGATRTITVFAGGSSSARAH